MSSDMRSVPDPTMLSERSEVAGRQVDNVVWLLEQHVLQEVSDKCVKVRMLAHPGGVASL